MSTHATAAGAEVIIKLYDLRREAEMPGRRKAMVEAARAKAS